MKHLGDITKIDGRTVPKVCVVIGGSPCQDLSVAGKRSGLSGERSGLFMEMIRIIKEMREDDKRNGRTGSDVRPRFMVWENVPGAFSSNKGEDFRVVLEEIVKVVSDCAVIPRPPKNKWRNTGVILGDGFSVAWRVLDAQFWGVPQRRRRIALVADFGGSTAPEILFERESVSGDSSTCRTPWEGTAGDAENGVGKAVSFVNRGHFRTDGVSETLRSECHQDVPCAAMGFKPRQSEKARSLGCEVEKAPSLETSQNAAICIQGNCIDRADTAGCNGKGWRDDDICFTLNTVDRPAVYAIENHPADSRVRVSGDGIVQTLSFCIGNGQVDSLGMQEKAGALNCMHDQQAIISIDRVAFNQGKNACYNINISDDGIAPSQIAKGPSAVCAVDCRNGTENPDINGTLQSKPNGGMSLNLQNVVRVYSIVRRLTPLECERLQGFPDGWTDIGEWTDSKGKAHKTSDSARYKALGNSIALPPWRYVLSGVIKYCGGEKTMASLFDGIGGFPLIWRELGGNTVWASEIEEFPIAVTKKHFN